MKRLMYLIGVVILIISCKEVYEVPPQSFLQASLYNSSTNKITSSSITVWGIGLENFWMKDSLLSEVVLIPLSSKDTSSYLISFDNQIDTVTFFHETDLKYASMETGFYYEYKLRSIDITHNRLDSVQITDSLVTQNWHENIKFYLHPLSAGGN